MKLTHSTRRSSLTVWSTLSLPTPPSCLHRLLLLHRLHRHHVEHFNNPCNEKNFAVTKTFKNIAPESCCLILVLAVLVYWFNLCTSHGCSVRPIPCAHRFLAIHLHLRYQEVVTLKRAVAVAVIFKCMQVKLTLRSGSNAVLHMSRTKSHNRTLGRT